MKLEIERKFLLKSVPSELPIEIIQIEQFYYKNFNGVWERARSCNSNINGMYYIHTVKTRVSKGVNMENEKNITIDEFEKFKTYCFNKKGSRSIKKKRLVYKDDFLFWEVDIFDSGLNLIIAEVELPRKKFKLKIPDFIKSNLLIEVTRFSKFSSRQLSNEIKISNN